MGGFLMKGAIKGALAQQLVFFNSDQPFICVMQMCLLNRLHWLHICSFVSERGVSRGWFLGFVPFSGVLIPWPILNDYSLHYHQCNIAWTVLLVNLERCITMNISGIQCAALSAVGYKLYKISKYLILVFLCNSLYFCTPALCV